MTRAMNKSLTPMLDKHGFPSDEKKAEMDKIEREKREARAEAQN